SIPPAPASRAHHTRNAAPPAQLPCIARGAPAVHRARPRTATGLHRNGIDSPDPAPKRSGGPATPRAGTAGPLWALPTHAPCGAPARSYRASSRRRPLASKVRAPVPHHAPWIPPPNPPATLPPLPGRSGASAPSESANRIIVLRHIPANDPDRGTSAPECFTIPLSLP